MVTNDLTIYSEFSHEWWTPGAPRFRSLQNLTPFRLGLINEFLGNLNGKSVTDLGCGGGLLSIPLIESGANVTGVDLSEPSIIAARSQAQGRGTFIVSDLASVSLPSESADFVLLADVLDHIPQFVRALREAARLLRPGGKLFVGTINRTWTAWFFSIFLGESLNLIPKGTHDFKLFIKPEELIEAADSVGLKLLKIQGEWPMLFKTIFKWAICLRKSNSSAVAYSLVFEK